MPTQELIAIVDRSGSMRGKETDTVGGINTMIHEVKSKMVEGDVVRVSLKLFDNEEILKWRSVDINEISEFPVNEFVPRGSTALLDAIGFTITFFMEKKLINPNAYDSCLICVATDGLENASIKYNKDTIKRLIKNGKETYNIDIVYLGANQDAILEAANIGITEERAINYNENSDSTTAVYRSVGRVVSDNRRNVAPEFSHTERAASQTPR
jgi:uncharacterized protein YegL